METRNNWPAAGAFSLALAVALGAFGAHQLRGHLDAYLMSVYEKGVFYHFVHALGILIVTALSAAGLLSAKDSGRISAMLLSGIALFSGSLYALALSGRLWWGAVTPFGGVSFIAAWLWLAWALLRRNPSQSR